MDITQISSLNPAIKLDGIPLESLANHPDLPESAKLTEATRQFEAIFLRQILQQARGTLIASKYTDVSLTSGVYQDLINSHLAQSISESGGFGLSHALQAQLLPRESTSKAPSSEPENQL